MKLHEKLQKLRKENNYSQEQLADLLNVSRQTISKWENGTITPTTDRLQELCNIYHISLSELLGETEPSKNEPPKPSTIFSKIDKKIWIIGGALASLLLIALLIFIGANTIFLHRRLNTLQDQINLLEGTVQSYTNTPHVYTPDYSASSENSLLSSFDVQFIKNDIPANTVVFRLSATPKEFHENDTGEFIFDDGTESKTISTELKDGTYQAEFSFPRDGKTVALFFKITNGKDFQTEALGNFPDFPLKAEYCINQFPDYDLAPGIYKCRLSGDLEVEIIPAYAPSSDLISYPTKATLFVKQNDKIIENFPLDIDDEIEQITSSSENRYMSSYSVILQENMDNISIKTKDTSHEFTFEVLFTDNWGKETVVTY